MKQWGHRVDAVDALDRECHLTTGRRLGWPCLKIEFVHGIHNVDIDPRIVQKNTDSVVLTASEITGCAVNADLGKKIVNDLYTFEVLVQLDHRCDHR